MSSTTTPTSPDHASAAGDEFLFDSWFDPIEAGLRERVRGFIETMIRTELDEALGRARYARSSAAEGEPRPAGHRHGSRTRTLTGSFGTTEIKVPRARLSTEEGATTEWKSKALRADPRRTQAADALIASDRKSVV